MSILKKITNQNFLWAIYFFLIPFENVLETFFGIKTQLKPYRLVVIIIMSLVVVKILRKKRIVFNLQQPDYTLYLFFSVGLIVTFINYYIDSTNFDVDLFFTYIFQLCLGFISYNLIRAHEINKTEFIRLFDYYLVGTTINCIYLIIQSYFFVEALDYHRPSGFVSNPNAAGLQLIIAMFFIFYKLKNSSFNYAKNLFYIALNVLYIIGIFKTQSRTSLLLAVLFLTIVFMSLSILKKIQFGFIGIIFLVIFGGIILNSDMISRIERKSKSNRPDERVELWNKSIELGIDSKFLGIGIGQFQRRSYARHYFALSNFPTVRNELRKGEIGLGLHNTFLHVLINYGFICFILFLIFILYINRKLYLNLKSVNFKPDSIEFFSWGIFLLIIIFSFSSELLLSPLFWILQGLFSSTIHEDNSKVRI